jgi:hypothetical protein
MTKAHIPPVAWEVHPLQKLARSGDTKGRCLQLIGLHGLDAAARKREPL